MTLAVTFDVIILILSLVVILMISAVVYRTEKGLDRAYKYYLAMAVVLFLASAMILNSTLELVDIRYTKSIFTASRMLGLIFFILGTQTVLMIIKKESKK